jgi:hypothetical protein
MSYGMSARKARGDPFLGSIVKGIGKIAGAVLPGPVGAAARILTGGGGGGAAPAPPSVSMPGGGLFRGLGPTTTRSLTVNAQGQVVRKRRRMNYSNQKALRRSLRRVTGYARQQKAIKKAAREFAREFGPKHHARRDVVVPRHTRVR